MNRRPLLPFLLLAVGGALLLLGGVLAARRVVFLRHAARATATITDQTRVVDSTGGRRPSVTYRPTLTFQTPDGHWVVFTSSSSTSSSHSSGGHWTSTTPRIHDRVPVAYDPAHPTEAVVATFGHLWAGTLVCCGLAAPFLLFGAVFFLLSRSGQ